MNSTTNNTNSKPIIIACDHGYGNMKTAHTVFKTGVTAYDKEPTFKSNLLVYKDRYYIIGDEQKEFTAEKIRRWTSSTGCETFNRKCQAVGLFQAVISIWLSSMTTTQLS